MFNWLRNLIGKTPVPEYWDLDGFNLDQCPDCDDVPLYCGKHDIHGDCHHCQRIKEISA